MGMEKIIQDAATESYKIMGQLLLPEVLSFMEKTAMLLAERFSQGKKVLIAGNGGSLCDAAHFAEELTGCFRKRRRALPAIVLSEAGHMTCVANDFSYEEVFSRMIEALGREGDIFIALSTSGNSANIVKAVAEAREQKMAVICLLGKGGGLLRGKGDFELVVEDATTSDRIQELHMAVLHIIIEGIESKLFS